MLDVLCKNIRSKSGWILSRLTAVSWAGWIKFSLMTGTLLGINTAFAQQGADETSGPVSINDIALALFSIAIIGALVYVALSRRKRDRSEDNSDK